MSLFFQPDSLFIESKQRVKGDTWRLFSHMYRAVSEVDVLVWVPRKHALKQRIKEKFFTWKVIPGNIERESEKGDWGKKNDNKRYVIEHLPLKPTGVNHTV